MRLAVSGHRDLYGHTAVLVADAISKTLADLAPAGSALTGITCLADGADTIFADAVLAHGGCIEAIVPASAYRDGLPEAAIPAYDRLLAVAAGVRRLDHVESTSESHMEASEQMLTDADQLIAVWDGLSARGYGGTADVVAHARERSIQVTVIWPDGACRG